MLGVSQDVRAKEQVRTQSEIGYTPPHHSATSCISVLTSEIVAYGFWMRKELRAAFIDMVHRYLKHVQPSSRLSPAST